MTNMNRRILSATLALALLASVPLIFFALGQGRAETLAYTGQSLAPDGGRAGGHRCP